MREVLRQRPLKRAIVSRAPRVVREPVQQALVRVDSAESSERLEGSVRIDAVDIDLRELIVIDLHDARDGERDLPGELPAIAE